MTLKRKYMMLVDLLKKTDYNAKITKIEDKIPSIPGLTATANKMLHFSDLVKKTDYDTIKTECNI